MPLPRYHFHLDECGTVTRDVDGSDHDDIDAARRVATHAVRDILCEELKHGHLCLDCHIDITDDDDRPIERLRFAEVVVISGLPAR